MMDQILFSAGTASRKAWEVHWVPEGEEKRNNIQTAKPLLLSQIQAPDLYCLVLSLRTSLPSNALNYMEETILEHLCLRLLDSHIPVYPELQNNLRIKPEIQ